MYQYPVVNGQEVLFLPQRQECIKINEFEKMIFENNARVIKNDFEKESFHFNCVIKGKVLEDIKQDVADYIKSTQSLQKIVLFVKSDNLIQLARICCFGAERFVSEYIQKIRDNQQSALRDFSEPMVEIFLYLVFGKSLLELFAQHILRFEGDLKKEFVDERFKVFENFVQQQLFIEHAFTRGSRNICFKPLSLISETRSLEAVKPSTRRLASLEKYGN